MSIKTKPSKEDFESIFFSMSNSDTAEHFGVSLTTVFNWARKFGTPRKSLRYKDLNIELTDVQQQVLNGSLLGDGSLGKVYGTNHSFYREVHCLKQESYIRWKYNLLKPFTVSIRRICNNKKYEAYHFHSVRHPHFTYLESQWYARKDDDYLTYNNKRIKCVPDNLKLTPLTLSVWYLDDGWKSKDNLFYLSTHSFSIEDCLHLVELMGDMNIESYIRLRTKKNLPEVCIKAKSKDTFNDIVKTHLPCQEMSYKLI